jgi:ABC-2 type transport system ATP-binding protein
MIALRNVSKQYEGVTINKDSGVYLWIKNFARLTSNKASPLLAVSDVSFTVDRGEVFGIFGANGAGKTTLIKLLSGLLAPSSGTIEVNGKTGCKQIKNAVGYISTNGWMGLEWQLTARENLRLYGNMFGIFGKQLDSKCDEALRAVGMTEAKDKYVSQLSAGMRQKVTIARGLVLDKPVVFFDEPSVSLDVQSAGSLRALIQADAEQNKRTTIIASHNAADLAVCGRIMLLSKGEIIALGTPDELASPLSGIQMLEIRCLNRGRNIRFDVVDGVESVTYGNVEGERDAQSIKIGVRKSGFSFHALIDYMLENNVAAHSINPIKMSLQEVYEYYLARKDGGGIAV